MNRTTLTQRLQARRQRGLLVSLLMVLVAIAMVFPFYIIGVNSFKDLRQFYESPIFLPSTLYLVNYEHVLGSLNYFQGLLNNVIVLGSTLGITILFGSMAAYVIARRPSRLKHFVYLFFILGITLPTFTMLIPQVKLIGSLGLKNNFLGLILLYTSMGMPIALFLYHGFFGSVPSSLEEAAKIDGASLSRIYRVIFFPLSGPTTASLTLLLTISVWNDYVLPDMIMTLDQFKTLMPSLQSFYGRMLGQGTRWDYIYAFIVLCILPIIVLFYLTSRHIIRGVIDGALKG